MKLNIVLLWCSLAACAQNTKPSAPGYVRGQDCRVFLMMVEKDDATSNLEMTGMTSGQIDWVRHNQHKPFLTGLCPLPYDPTNKRVPAETIDDKGFSIDPGARPVFIVRWKQETFFVPDNNGGHVAVHSTGILYSFSNTEKGKLIPIGPVHDSSHTIFSDSTVSFLKAVIKMINSQPTGGV